MALSDHIKKDTPTNNFATLNPLFQVGAALSNGNLRITDNTSNPYFFRPTTLAFPNIGKWYAEFYFESVNNNSDIYVKVHHDGLNLNDNRELSIRSTTSAARIYSEDVNTTYNSATGELAIGSIVGILVDFDNNKVIYNEDGFYSGEASITSNDNYNYYFGVGFDNVPGTKTVIANFGQDSTFNAGTSAGSVTDENGYGLFKHTPVNSSSDEIKDFKSLCTANLEDITPNVDDDVPKDYFKAVKYDGDGNTNQSITGIGFQPDLVWLKERSSNSSHQLHDSIRGAGRALITNSTNDESDYTSTYLNSLDSDGFRVGSSGAVNESSQTYVAWCFRAGGSPSGSNIYMKDDVGYETLSAAGITAGTITPTAMSVNTKAGFSIVKYSGNGSIPHGLSLPLDLLIVKAINLNGENWGVWHSSFSSGDYIYLNSPNQKYNNSSKFSGVPNSTVFQVGSDNTTGNPSYNYIAYCWHSVPGYSAFGSYVGTSITDGTFVYCGFKPTWVMIKAITAQATANQPYASWFIADSARSLHNPSGGNNVLWANYNINEGYRGDGSTANASVYLDIDFLSNGFKLRNGGSVETNRSDTTYIYAAFAEQPIKYATAR